jgi:hypothetical protein
MAGYPSDFKFVRQSGNRNEESWIDQTRRLVETALVEKPGSEVQGFKG